LLLDRTHHFAKEGGVELIQKTFEMVKVPKPAHLFADLRTGGGKGDGTTVAAGKTMLATVAHKRLHIYLRYI
jgi:hypothetical protein